MTEVPRLVIASIEARTDRLEKAMAKASATTTRRFDEMTAGSSRASRRISADMDKAASGIERASSKIGGIMSGFGKGLALGAAGAIGITALSEIPKIMREIVAEGAGLVDTANKVGMTTESLQELHFAATQGGASIEDFDKALGVFAKGVGEASQGGGELGKVFAANGIAIRDSAGSIRPAAELLRSYADLIKNAGSEQERARLTAIGFGRAGDDLANVMRDGAAGIDDAAAAANRLGLVIDDAMLQRIADIDDRWDAFATTLETRTKSAVLETVNWLDTLAGRIQQLGAQLDHFRQEQAGEALSPGAMIGALAGDGKDPMSGAKAGAAEQLRAGLAAGAPSWSGRDDWLGVTKPTVLPAAGGGSTRRSGAGGGRDQAADRAEREQEAIDRLVESLKSENDLVGKSDADRAVANNLRTAGTAATKAQRTEIENLTRTLGANEAAYRRTQDAVAGLKDGARDVLGGLISDLRSGVSGAEALANAFDKLADRLVDLALNAALDSMLGDGSGKSSPAASGGTGVNVLGVISKFLGLADGGMVRGPGTSRSDSIPARLSNGEFVVRAAATSRHRQLLEAINAGAPGLADGGFLGSSAAPVGGLARSMMSSAPTVSISAPITVNGSSGTPEQNQDLAERMRREMEASMRGVIADEMRKSARPGNALNNRSR